MTEPAASQKKALFRRTLGAITLAIATLCAGLSTVELNIVAKRPVSDLLLVIDITQSMNVKDVTLDGAFATRLDFAKRASQEALLHLPCGSKLALAIFSAHRSFVMFKSVEICEHYDELWTSLATLDWRAAWVSRSEVSKGLFSAMKVLPEIGEHTRVVFVSDGHEAPPLHETYRPKLSQKVERRGGLIIGLGGSEPVRIPKFGPNGESQGFWRSTEVMQVDTYRLGRSNGEALAGVDISDLDSRIAAGREHLSWLKAEHLQRLAAEADMQFRAVDSVAEFVEAISDPALQHEIDGQRSLSPIFAFAALLFLLMRLLLPWIPSREET